MKTIHRRDINSKDFYLLNEAKKGFTTLSKKGEIKYFYHKNSKINIINWTNENSNTFEYHSLIQKNADSVIISRADFRKICKYIHQDVKNIINVLIKFSMLSCTHVSDGKFKYIYKFNDHDGKYLFDAYQIEARRFGFLKNSEITRISSGISEFLITQGIHIQTVRQNVEKSNKNGELMELDILGIGAIHIFLMAIKNQFGMDDIQNFLKDIAEFRLFFPEYADKKIVGGISGKMDCNSEDFANKSGLFIISNKSIGKKLFVPNTVATSFKPKIY